MIKRIRFYAAFLNAVVRRGKRNLLLGFVGLLFILGFVVYLFPLISLRAEGLYSDLNKPTFIEGVVGKPTYPNPLFDDTETENDISSLVFRGLLKVDREGRLIPDLAINFEQKNDLEYVASLKKDVFWQDGEKFNADDVLYTIKLAREEKSKLADNFKDIVVEKVDDFTVRFKLKEAFSPFPYAATTLIMPEHIKLNSYRPIGLGSFEVKQVLGDKITLSNKKLNIVFKFYKSIDDVKIALKLGEVHAVGGLSPQEAEEINRFGSANQFVEAFPDRQGVVYFNTRSGFLRERSVRQGLSLSVDKERLRKVAGGQRSVLSTGPFALRSIAPQPKERYPFSMDNALKSFLGAGYKLENEKLTKDGKRVSLTIISTDDPELNSIVNFLKDSWLNLGVEVKTRHVDSATLINYIVPNHNFEVLVNFQKISPDPDQYVLWHTTQVQTTNITGISQPNLDKLLEDARKTSDESQRTEKYKTFSTLLLDEAPAIFLYYPQYSWYVSRKVSNVELKNFVDPKNRFDSFGKWGFSNNLLN